jgi:hypothetical protein
LGPGGNVYYAQPGMAQPYPVVKIDASFIWAAVPKNAYHTPEGVEKGTIRTIQIANAGYCPHCTISYYGSLRSSAAFCLMGSR